METLISARNITCIQRGKKILDNISLDLYRNDFLTVIGPNGAGKTILIKALLGLVTIDSGMIKRARGMSFSYVPQRISGDGLMPLKVERFMRLGINTDAGLQKRVINLTRTGSILDHTMHTLSGGELQRLLLARALLRRPDILVLDEPAQNLDINGQTEFYKLLETIYNTSDVSILIVSHDLHLVLAQSRKVICIYHHVCCSGRPQTVTRDPEFINIFGREFAKTMAVYHHGHDHNHRHD